MRAIAGVAALAVVAGCAQIRSTSKIEVVPKPGAQAMVLGGPSGQIMSRGAEVQWVQHAGTLDVHVVETRVCREVRHHPVTRVEHVDRKAGAAIYWEYGVGAVALGFGLAALIKPEFLSPEAVNPQGEVVKDTRTGYRVGAIFTAIGAAFLVAGIYDTVRSRDATYYADAYRLEFGDRVDCAAPRLPMRDAEVEVIVGEWHEQAKTNDDGRVTFVLPAELDVKIAVEPEPEPTTSSPAGEGRGMPQVSAVPAVDGHDIREGVIRLDPRRATAFDFAVPFASTAASGHAGASTLPALRRRNGP